jgi:hypothetical protein
MRITCSQLTASDTIAGIFIISSTQQQQIPGLSAMQQPAAFHSRICPHLGHFGEQEGDLLPVLKNLFGEL